MNWGKGIVVAIIGFIGFIMYFVITMNTDDAYNHDLVTDKYYEKELNYQSEIDAARNAAKLKGTISVQKTSEGLQIYFPVSLEEKKIKGNVFLYRPSNKQLDFEMPILLSNHYLLVPDKRLLDGRWNITLDVKYDNKRFLFNEEITY